MLLDFLEILKFVTSGVAPFLGTWIFIVTIGGISLQAVTNATAAFGARKDT